MLWLHQALGKVLLQKVARQCQVLKAARFEDSGQKIQKQGPVAPLFSCHG